MATKAMSQPTAKFRVRLPRGPITAKRFGLLFEKRTAYMSDPRIAHACVQAGFEVLNMETGITIFRPLAGTAIERLT